MKYWRIIPISYNKRYTLWNSWKLSYIYICVQCCITINYFWKQYNQFFPFLMKIQKIWVYQFLLHKSQQSALPFLDPNFQIICQICLRGQLQETPAVLQFQTLDHSLYCRINVRQNDSKVSFSCLINKLI